MDTKDILTSIKNSNVLTDINSKYFSFKENKHHGEIEILSNEVKTPELNTLTGCITYNA